MLFDTDIFIWIQRGNVKAAQLVEGADERLLSVQTYMELLQGAKNQSQCDRTRAFLRDFGFRTLPLTENIGHRAAVYVETYALSHNMRAGDAIVAATAMEFALTLCTANGKHFRPVKDLKLKILTP